LNGLKKVLLKYHGRRKVAKKKKKKRKIRQRSACLTVPNSTQERKKGTDEGEMKSKDDAIG